MSALSRFSDENGAWDAVTKERERIAKVIREFDDFAYHEPDWAGGASVVDERPSMERLAILIKCGE